MPDAEPRMYLVSEVAKELRCSTRTVRRAIARGELYAVKVGSLVRVPASEVRALTGAVR